MEASAAKCSLVTCYVANLAAKSAFDLIIDSELVMAQFEGRLNSSKFTSEILLNIEPDWYDTDKLNATTTITVKKQVNILLERKWVQEDASVGVNV